MMFAAKNVIFRKQAMAMYKKALAIGYLIPPKRCELCNTESDGFNAICGHHKDYAYPLDVLWVCSSCHAKIHSPLPRAQPRRHGRDIPPQWTPERVADYCLKYIGGNVSWTQVWTNLVEPAHELSRAECARLVKFIWTMDSIEIDGVHYRTVVGKGRTRWLEPVAPDKVLQELW